MKKVQNPPTNFCRNRFCKTKIAQSQTQPEGTLMALITDTAHPQQQNSQVMYVAPCVQKSILIKTAQNFKASLFYRKYFFGGTDLRNYPGKYEYTALKIIISIQKTERGFQMMVSTILILAAFKWKQKLITCTKKPRVSVAVKD